MRFRHTYGTLAAEAGHSEHVIAHLLDHTTTDHVTAYVHATPAIRKRIDHAMAMRLGPLVRAFKGEVVAPGTGAGGSLIADPQFDAAMRPLGACAHHGSCDWPAPIGCYTCGSYRPWANGPHKKVLDYLLSEGDRLSAEHSPLIASARDRTVLAVAEVVKLCNADGAQDPESDRG